MESQGERLLQNLVDHEQALVAKVEEAKGEAAEIISEAEAKARKIKADANTRAETLSKEQAETTRAEGERSRKEVMDEAERGVQALRAQAKKNKAKAVKLVMERVLP